MIVGVPTEIKPQENRVAIVPAGVHALASRGHTVLVQAGAGLGSGLTDEELVESGAEISPDAEDLWSRADMIWKVKEPVAAEYPLMRPGQIIYAYLHLAPDRQQTQALMDAGVVAIAYETIERPDGSLPLLAPMSEVAGRLSVQAGARCLERFYGGRGVLLGGIPGVPPGRVVVIGGGSVGRNAAWMAVGLGAEVAVLDINLDRLRWFDDNFHGRIHTLYSSRLTIHEAVARADLVIGAVLVPGARAPSLVTRDDVAAMRPGAAIVDVAIDQGGCVETIRPTTHADPTFTVDEVVHYGVTNMPGAVPRTSTFGLHNATHPYAVMIADLGWEAALAKDPALALGLNVCRGKITHAAVAAAHEDLPYEPC